MTKEQEENIKVTKAMLKYGGSFVKALGEALSHADPINTKKIKKAFPEYWEEYRLISNSKEV
jgi:hypothetical protein